MSPNGRWISIFDGRLSVREESAGAECDGHLKYTLCTQNLGNHNCRFGSACSSGCDIVA